MEKIKHAPGETATGGGYKGGNKPWHDGFYECDATGKEVEHVNGKWDRHLYVCNGCGVIIDQATLEIIGQTMPLHKLKSKNALNLSSESVVSHPV